MPLHNSNNTTSFGGGSFAGAGAGGQWGEPIILPEISIFADKDKFTKLSLFLFALLLYLINKQ